MLSVFHVGKRTYETSPLNPHKSSKASIATSNTLQLSHEFCNKPSAQPHIPPSTQIQVSSASLRTLYIPKNFSSHIIKQGFCNPFRHSNPSIPLPALRSSVEVRQDWRQGNLHDVVGFSKPFFMAQKK